jgi:multidrug efflux pump subunit AcrB
VSKRPKNFQPDDSFFAFTVKRPIAILMVVVAVVVFGGVSYQRLALTLMPDMSYPTLTVRTVYPGTAPEEMENVVSRPLEQQLGIIPKLVSISSISKAGQSDVILEFQWKADMNVVAQEVREKIDRIRLPDGAQRPLLLHYDPSLDPIIRLGFAGPQSLYELRHVAENEIKRKLESLPGVAAIEIKGGLEEQFLVALDEGKLATLRLDITQIGQRLSGGNVNLSGGNLREGQTEYVIRTLNEFRSLEEIGALIIARQNNVDIRLRDIGTVSRFHKDREVITRVNGQESVEIEVYKEADANVVVVAETVRTALYGRPDQQAYVAKLGQAGAEPAPPPVAKKRDSSTKTKRGAGSAYTPARRAVDPMQLIERRQMTDFITYELPPGSRIELLADQSVFISKSIDEVRNNAIFGAIIAVLVLYLFLRNISQTVIIAVGIPVSVVATFAPMYMADVSLNIISLGGLALGVGMLVDNGIVVLESIFRCREEGDDYLTSVVRGTQEVGMAVVASTVTTVAVFFPIVFVEGVAGQVFGDMALTVVFSLLASLATALFLVPMLASRRLAPVAATGGAEEKARGRDSGLRLPAHYLQFPRTESSRIAGVAGVAVTVARRLGWAVAVIAAVVLKAVAAIAALVLAPLLLAVPALARRKHRAGPAEFPGSAYAERRLPGGPTPWSRVAAWLADDGLGRARGEWVWPGALAVRAVESLGAKWRAVTGWLAGRRWRWIFLLVLPALIVAGILIARQWAPSLAPRASAFPSGMPPAPGTVPPAGSPWWKWFATTSWWLLVLLLVPGIVPLVFLLVRFVAEVALRLVGTLVQASVMVVALVLAGAVRITTLLMQPVTSRVLTGFELGYQRVQAVYPRLLGGALRNRFAVLGGAALAFLVCWVLVMPRIGRELIPQVHQGEFNLDITLPIGTPLERTGEVAGRIDAFLTLQSEVERTALTVGAQPGATTSILAGEHTARLTVKMKPDRHASGEAALIDRVRSEFRNVPEMRMEVSYPALFSIRSPIEVEIRGHNLETLKRLSRDAEAALAEKVPGLVDVRSVLQAGHPEIQIVYQRDRLAEYGLNLRSVADLVRTKVQGRVATQFRKEDQLIDIVVRLREEDRLGIEELRGLIVNPGGSVAIPLSAIAELSVNEGPSEIRRVDQQRTALITANLRNADLATVSARIFEVMSELSLPGGFSFAVAGQNKEMKTSLNSLLFAFALALFLVYIVMASQFESLVQPFLIMMTVPLALIGVALVLWTVGIPISIMVFLGLIILAGIVVNNAIVLVDYINRLRARGLDLATAIMDAGRARLRPILMTTLTTVLGLLPMALGLGEGAEIRAPMAITVIVGLSSSTVLTLIVIPTLYYQFAGRRGPTRIASVVEPDVSVEPEPQPMAK